MGRRLLLALRRSADSLYGQMHIGHMTVYYLDGARPGYGGRQYDDPVGFRKVIQ
jgi:hypothetical protein